VRLPAASFLSLRTGETFFLDDLKTYEPTASQTVARRQSFDLPGDQDSITDPGPRRNPVRRFS
jgi:hypothetical protein